MLHDHLVVFTCIYMYLVLFTCKLGFDTAENEPHKVMYEMGYRIPAQLEGRGDILQATVLSVLQTFQNMIKSYQNHDEKYSNFLDTDAKHAGGAGGTGRGRAHHDWPDQSKTLAGDVREPASSARGGRQGAVLGQGAGVEWR